MTKVFIGGSRRVSRLDSQVRERLDEIVRKQLWVLIGDANGADRAVQHYLQSCGHSQVEVFCTEGRCRNNLGNWKLRAVHPPHGGKRDFEYYAAKDRQMTEECSIGFMLWDGKSRGTLSNVLRLIGQGKTVVLYLAPAKQFRTLRSESDWEQFNKDAQQRFEQPSIDDASQSRASR